MAVQTPTALPLHQFSLEAYLRLVESGALAGQHVELIDGLIVDKADYDVAEPGGAMTPQSVEHAAVIQRLCEHFRGRARVQMPLQIADQLPEPDLAVTDEPASFTAYPQTARLVIEVAVTSHVLDRGRKSELYASAEIPVFWIVDVPARAVEVRTEPSGGQYRTLRTYQIGESVPAATAETDDLVVADLFAGV